MAYVHRPSLVGKDSFGIGLLNPPVRYSQAQDEWYTSTAGNWPTVPARGFPAPPGIRRLGIPEGIEFGRFIPGGGSWKMRNAPPWALHASDSQPGLGQLTLPDLGTVTLPVLGDTSITTLIVFVGGAYILWRLFKGGKAVTEKSVKAYRTVSRRRRRRAALKAELADL
jgi:hypothetical protein